VHLQPSPGWAEFTIMMERTPESGYCQSICITSSVLRTTELELCVLFVHCQGQGSKGAKEKDTHGM